MRNFILWVSDIQSQTFLKVRSIFKALKIQNFSFFRCIYAYLTYLLWFVSCNIKETCPRRLHTIDPTFEKVGSGWKPSDPKNGIRNSSNDEINLTYISSHSRIPYYLSFELSSSAQCTLTYVFFTKYWFWLEL